MHRTFYPTCRVRSVCWALAGTSVSGRDAPAKSKTIAEHETRSHRIKHGLVMALSKRDGGSKGVSQRLRGRRLLPPREDQHSATVRQQSDESPQNHNRTAEPDELHERVEIGMDHRHLRLWALPGIDDVQVFSQGGIDRHHLAGLFIDLE